MPGTEGKRNYKTPSLASGSLSSTPGADPEASKTLKEDKGRQRALQKILKQAKCTVGPRGEADVSAGNNDGAGDKDMNGPTNEHGDDEDENENENNRPAADEDEDEDENNRLAADDKFTDTPDVDEEECEKDRVLDTLIDLAPMPDWLQTAVDYLRCYQGHSSWLDVITLFVKFERHVSPGKVRVTFCHVVRH